MRRALYSRSPTTAHGSGAELTDDVASAVRRWAATPFEEIIALGRRDP